MIDISMDLDFMDQRIKTQNQPISNVTDVCKTDLISLLPDEILIRIVSLLPAKCMVATSLISRRWRYLWTFSTRINLESDLGFRNLELSEENDLYLWDFLDRESPEVILAQLFGGHNEFIKLNFCRISFCDFFSLTELDFRRWIPFLTLKRITKLRLEWLAFEGNPYDILAIPSLEKLFLGFCCDFCGVQPPSNGCVALQSLHLQSARLSDMALDTLINNAPRLEHLTLSRCFSLENPIVHSQVLKRLEIESVKLSSLNIDTPALNTLLLTYLDGFHNIKINAPSLLLLNISNVIEEDEIINRYDFPLQRQSENFLLMYQILGCPDKVAKFRNLQKLYVQIKLDNERCIFLAPVLRNCNYLHELGIVNKGVGTLGTESMFWKQRQEDTFFCLEHHMEYLWIEGFEWHKNEMEFLDFIVSKALILKKLVIWHDKNVNGNAEQIIARASSNLKVSILAEIA